MPAEGTPVPVAKADTIATLKTGTLSIFGELEPVEELAESLPAKRRRKARSATANDIEVPNTSAAHAALLAAKETAGSALPIEGCMSWSRNIKRNVFGLAGKRLNDHPSLDDWRGLGLVLAADRTPRPILPLLRNKGTFDDLMLRGASLRARLIGIGGDALAGPRMLAADMERLKGPRRLHVPATTQGIGLDVLSALIDLHEAHDGATWKMVGEWLAASSSDVYPKASGFSLGDLSRYGGEWFSKAIASAGRRGPATRASSAPIGPSLGHEYGASTLSPNESAMQRLRDRGHI